jgi:transmembrane channel-like protein
MCEKLQCQFNQRAKKSFFSVTIFYERKRDKNKFLHPRLFLALSQDVLSETDQIEQITQEIEQHDHLMEPNYKSEQARIDTIKSMPQSLTAKRLIRARLANRLHRRSRLSSNNSSAFRNFKFLPSRVMRRGKIWYRQFFKNFDFWYGSMKEIEGRFGSKIGVYFKILRYLVMLNIFVAIFTFR